MFEMQVFCTTSADSSLYLLTQDFPLAWERINPFGKKKIDVDTFAEFLELTDSDM